VKDAVRWRSLPLPEAFWFQEGPGVRKWQFTTSGIKLLNVANIEKDGTLNLEKTERHLDEAEVAKKYSHFLVDAGDLVIASSGISFDDDGLLRTRGAFVRGEHLPLCLNTSTIRFKAIRRVSDLRFLRLWLNGREFRSQITKLVTGTAQQNFGPSHLKATTITLPSLAEQQRIAAVLDQAETLRTKRRAALDQLDSFSQSLFLDLFGDPAANSKGWPIMTLNELCRGITDIDHKMPEAVEEGLPFISAKDLTGDGRISFENVKRISEEDFRRLSRKSRPEKGDIIYSRIGVNLGKARMVEVDFPFLASYSCCTIKPNDELVDVSYLCSLLDSPFTLRQAHKGVRAIAVPDLGMGEIKAFKIILPPIKLQREFSRRVGAVEKLKTAHRASLAELDALFASLQQRAFRGEL
jgi:type I restriction enzyme S subunit